MPTQKPPRVKQKQQYYCVQPHCQMFKTVVESWLTQDEWPQQPAGGLRCISCNSLMKWIRTVKNGA